MRDVADRMASISACAVGSLSRSMRFCPRPDHLPVEQNHGADRHLAGIAGGARPRPSAISIPASSASVNSRTNPGGKLPNLQNIHKQSQIKYTGLPASASTVFNRKTKVSREPVNMRPENPAEFENRTTTRSLAAAAQLHGDEEGDQHFPLVQPSVPTTDEISDGTASSLICVEQRGAAAHQGKHVADPA